MKTKIVCFNCRKQFAEAHMNTAYEVEVAYDWCLKCNLWLMRTFERDLLGARFLPLEFETLLLKERTR